MNDWIDLFCKEPKEKAEKIQENFSCQFVKDFKVESEPGYNSNECEEGIETKIVQM